MPPLPDDAAAALRELLATAPALALASIDATGALALDYVPFAATQRGFGVVRSGLAKQTATLATAPSVSILLAGREPAGDADAYARTRASIAVDVVAHAPQSPAAIEIWTALERRHGATVGVLATLPDLGAYELRPLAGRLVAGFASAHDLDDRTILAALAT